MSLIGYIGIVLTLTFLFASYKIDKQIDRHRDGGDEKNDY